MSIHVSTGVRMLDMLALVFVLYTGFVALAIVLPIVFWHEQQTRTSRLTLPTYRYRYQTAIPQYSRFPLNAVPLLLPKKLTLENRGYK
ncbi:MAG: hypothetical protein ABSD49_11690 [Candidatus Bathyarchaeia archaeon]